MSDLAWGLGMMAIGMGVVFALLAVLMGVLILAGRLDRPRLAAADSDAELVPDAPASVDAALPSRDDAPTVRILADGLDETQVAAIAIAVVTHAENHRRKAAPETRAHAPGSQLFASRWVSVGRGHQTRPFTRR